jgi:thiamine-phosphate pyrophosphorylase
MPHLFSASERRAKLSNAQLMLIFTPQLVNTPLDTLRKLIEHVDVIQVRPKNLGKESGTPSTAKDCLDWSRQVMDTLQPLASDRPLVLVNDRVDVAKSLIDQGVDGVHLGQEDTPWQLARDLLGPEALIGLSTHNYDQVRRAADTSIDYVGFGPIFPTTTKGLDAGDNSVPAWVAHQSCQIPLFPIGGITPSNAWQLCPVGRAAVASSVLCAEDPKQAALAVRKGLTNRGSQKRHSP